MLLGKNKILREGNQALKIVNWHRALREAVCVYCPKLKKSIGEK